LAAGLALLLGGTSCGGGNAGGPPGPIGGVGPDPPGGDLGSPAVSVQGGVALASGGQGQNGGVVHLVAQGDVSFDPTMAPARAPAAPSNATAVTSSALAADLSIPGDAVVTGTVSSTGGDAVRTISVGGSLYVTGTLASADLGSARQGFDLVVGGTIYLSGTIDAGGKSGSGEGAGAITLQAGGDVVLDGKVLLRGGTADALGGAGAKLTIDANGAVQLGGVIDARGGAATGSGGGATLAGGAAGEIHVGETAAPTSITVFAPVVASGGAGGASAGKGGTITPEPDTGNVNIAGPLEIDLGGGDSMSAPGAGGLLNGGARKDPGNGGVHVSGEIVASGGSITKGGSGNGADGGRVDMELAPTDGAVTIDASGKITARGGASGGSGTAGGGGHVWFFTKDGDETISGTVDVSGGDAPDPGGVGGLSGMIYFFSDNNHNGVQVCKGNLWVTPSGTLISSGGNGTTGGSGRNNGAGGVASFPGNQEEIAIFLNCDGEHGNTCNWMKNDGQLTARGGVHDGSGGDVVYHGIPPGVLGTGGPGSGDYPVPPGNVDNAADGSGMKGDFDGE
jgi:hypothetical protein